MKNHLISRLALCCLFLVSGKNSTSHADVVIDKLTWAPSGPAATPEKKQSENQTENFEGEKNVAALSKQKKFESGKQWTECATAAKVNFAQIKNLKGWILTSWLHCAREASLQKKNSDNLLPALKVADSPPQVFLTGPWKKELAAEAVKARMTFVELTQKAKPDEAWKQIEILIEQREHLDKPQRAKIYSVAGELAQNKAQLKAAQFFFEQSLNEQEAKATREKLSSVLFALNERKNSVATEKTEPDVSEAEGNFEERFKASSKSNDLITLMDDCISYLKQFPSGRRAKWAQERILEIYLSILEQNRSSSNSNSNSSPAANSSAGGDVTPDGAIAAPTASGRNNSILNANSLRDRSLSLMEKADGQRLLDWARQLHRRSDSVGSLRLAEKALGTLSESAAGAVLLYISGRSAQFLGDYKKSKKYFEQYVDSASGGEDFNEVLFRLGLVNLRLHEPSSAVAAFEKLLKQRNIDRYELNAKYWLFRSLQAVNNPRALAVADELLLKYPFSYYGLRMRMERAGGLLEWPTSLKTSKELEGEITYSSTQKKALERARLLAASGWISEALAELSEVPMPNEPAAKVLLAQKFSRWGIYPPAIRLVNEAGELDPELRSLEIINLSLPRAYQKLVDEQAAKQKLNPILIRSLIRQESAFGPKAISTSNAYGLMQLIGPTALEVASDMGLRGLSLPEDVFLPDNNVQMGTFYLKKMLKQFNGNVPLGLAAYNAGPARMSIFVQSRPEVGEQMQKFSSDPWDEMWFDELPWTETSFYVKAILRNTILYRLSNQAESPRVDERRVQFGSVIWDQMTVKP